MLKEYRPDLESILANWNLKPTRWEKIKDVFKVTTGQGLKNLKVSPLNPKRLAFVHHAVNHLTHRGFAKMNPLIPALNGETFISDGHYAYSLFDWIEGRQCNFANRSELVGATQVLAEFHQKSIGFTPPPCSNMRKQLGKCLNHFEQRFQNLKEYQAMALKMPDDPFARTYLESCNFLLPLANRAIVKLKLSFYRELVARAEIEKPFCHGDPAARNFILTPDSRILMIDFDSCRIDLPVMDLVKFTRRVMKKHHWSYPIAQLMVDAYQKTTPLTEAELEVIKAVFYFPQKFWRISTRYFHHHGEYPPERLLRKLQKYLQNREAIYQFPVQFEYYQKNSLGLDRHA